VSLTTTDDVALATAIVDGVSGARIPVLACFMGKALSTDGTDIIRSAGIPAFDFPEATAQALASMDRHRCYRDRPVGSVPTFDTDATRAREIVDRALGQGREDLTFFELRDLLRAYGIPTVETLQPSSLEEAVEGARTLGYPVVLKFLPPGISHKTDVGAVRTDLETEDALTDAWNSCAAAFPGAPCLLQKMLKAGREVILGMARDPVFGPLIMFGLGGITVEALGDVAFRVHPLTTTDPPEMIDSLRGSSLLRGFRGSPPVDENFLGECVLRLDRLITDLPELEEFEVNPFLTGAEPDAFAALDIRARLRSGDQPASISPGSSKARP
jgi:acyl-CoA synthetase (NDP forming)